MITPKQCNIPSGNFPTFDQEVVKLEDNLDSVLKGKWQGRSMKVLFPSGGYSQKCIKKAMSLYRKNGWKVTPAESDNWITALTFEPKD